MTDMRTMVVDYLHEDLQDPNKKKTQFSWLIRTYDSGTVAAMLARMGEEGIEYQLRLLSDTAMQCTQCNKWSEQQEYALDDNDKQAKCPLCNHWVYIEECNIEEI
jgi:hypothetical protein